MHYMSQEAFHDACKAHAERGRAEERAAIVAWLRRSFPALSGGEWGEAMRHCANALEAAKPGEYPS